MWNRKWLEWQAVCGLNISNIRAAGRLQGPITVGYLPSGGDSLPQIPGEIASHTYHGIYLFLLY
jgi:hypothetical protein